MKTTATLYVHGTKLNSTGEMVYSAYGCDMSKSSNHFGVLIAEVDVEVEFSPLSEREILDKVVDSLKSQKEEIEAKAYLDCKAIQDKIDSLLCLEYVPEVTA